MNGKIDFVITWVDSGDKEWLKEKNKYKYDKLDFNQKDIEEMTGNARFRDWDLLKYWFRGVEKFAPWVNKVHLITYGHLPEWINKKFEKLNIVNHEDYIPKKYLPTFSSHCIEFNVHRIEDLSENFVLFNDDFYIINDLQEDYFFENNVVKDQFIMNALTPTDQVFSKILYNNMALINRNFSKKDLKSIPFSKKYNLKYGKDLIRTISTIPYKNILGFHNPHTAQPFKKSLFKLVWEKEKEALENTCLNKFRSENDVNQYFIRYWNLLTNNFLPVRSFSKYFTLEDNNIYQVVDSLRKRDKSILIINDSEDIVNFEDLKQILHDEFSKILPEKSSFEK